MTVDQSLRTIKFAFDSSSRISDEAAWERKKLMAWLVHAFTSKDAVAGAVVLRETRKALDSTR